MTRPLRLLCYALLALGLAVATYSATLRVQADSRSNRVLVLVDWRDLNGLVEGAGEHPISDRGSHRIPWGLLSTIPGAYLAYGEETVGDLLSEGILSPADVSTSAPTYEVSDKSYDQDILRGANRHGYPIEYYKGKLLVEVPIGHDGASAQPLCWRSDVFAMAKAKGVLPLLRPSGTQYFSMTGLEDTLQFCDGQPLVLFQGTQIPGFPQSLGEVAAILKKQRQQFGWVEFDDQSGGAQLASLMSPSVARVHSITSDEMAKYTIQSAVTRYQLAVCERGIRVLFLRPFTSMGLNEFPVTLDEPDTSPGSTHGFRTDLANLNGYYFGSIREMLKDNGFTIGVPKRFSSPPKWLRPLRSVAITLSATAGFLLLLTLFVPLLTTRWAAILLVLGIIAALASAVMHSVFTLVLLATGIIFPTLGFWMGLYVYQRATDGKDAASANRIIWALVGLLTATVISAAGGLLIHGGMWDARALLHIDQYRGVTIALAVPVLLVAAYCWQAESLQEAWDGARRELASFWQRFTRLWMAPIRYGDVAIILIAVGALGVMLLRSGNEGPVGVIAGEGSFRAFLEHALSVRPRTKELLGHPLLVLFLVTLPWRSRLSLLFALAGIVGQVSVLNTFEHLHTPLLITLQRVGIGLLIGAVSGALLGLIGMAIGRILVKPESKIQSLSERAEAS